MVVASCVQNEVVNDIVHASPTKISADASLQDWAFVCTTAGTSGADYSVEPTWDSKVASVCSCTPVTTYTESTGVASPVERDIGRIKHPPEQWPAMAAHLPMRQPRR